LSWDHVGYFSSEAIAIVYALLWMKSFEEGVLISAVLASGYGRADATNSLWVGVLKRSGRCRYLVERPLQIGHSRLSLLLSLAEERRSFRYERRVPFAQNCNSERDATCPLVGSR